MNAASAPTIGPDAADASQMAQNLARNCGYAMLPCGPDGQPLVPLRIASKLPLAISNMWLRDPGTLVGIATGAVSRLWVLEIGTGGADWWEQRHERLLPTRVYETRSGGLHLFYRDGEGVPCTSDRIHADVCTHGDGGCIVHWFAAGLACRDQSPPAPFPRWLRALLLDAAT
jgi:hypothetical protein